jgi:hypothetical protein
MSAKKTKMNGAQPSVDDEGYLRLSGDKLWKWRALEAELRAAQAELETVSHQIQLEIAKNPDLSALLQRKAALAGTMSTSKAEISTMQVEIEKEFGIALKEHSFDDKTGRLYYLGPDGSQAEPVKPKSRKRK